MNITTQGPFANSVSLPGGLCVLQAHDITMVVVGYTLKYKPP